MSTHRITAVSAREVFTPARAFAVVFGFSYLAVGVVGFYFTGFHGFAAMDGPKLLGVFMINPLHNLVHIALGAAWLVGSRTHQAARLVNLAIGGLLGLVTVLGFAHCLMFLGIPDLGAPDNFLHLLSATLALYFGSLGADRLPADPQG